MASAGKPSDGGVYHAPWDDDIAEDMRFCDEPGERVRSEDVQRPLHAIGGLMRMCRRAAACPSKRATRNAASARPRVASAHCVLESTLLATAGRTDLEIAAALEPVLHLHRTAKSAESAKGQLALQTGAEPADCSRAQRCDGCVGLIDPATDDKGRFLPQPISVRVEARYCEYSRTWCTAASAHRTKRMSRGDARRPAGICRGATSDILRCSGYRRSRFVCTEAPSRLATAHCTTHSPH
jgi:hypothetical protein